MCPFNTGGCLIEVTAWAGLTVIDEILLFYFFFISGGLKLLCFFKICPIYIIMPILA